jgi:ABC-type transport system involved in cytochrome c biogenesis permease component
LALLRKDLNSGVPWWLGPLLQTVIGLALLLVAALKSFGRAQANTPVVAVESSDHLPAPLRWMMKTLTGLWEGIVSFYEGAMELVRRADEGLVQWSKRWGNPVLTDEMNRRLRREHWPLGWTVLLVIGIGFLAQAFYFMGAGLQGRFVGGLALAVMLLLGFSASLRLGLSFDRDRANGTLVFLFLTPLSEKEIAWGKLWANVIYTGGSLLALLPFLLVGIVLEMVRGNFLLPLLGLLAFAFILSIVAYFSGAGLLGAVWARKPSQGISVAFLAGCAVQLVFLSLLGVGAFISVGFNFEALQNRSLGLALGCLLFVFNCLLAVLSWQVALKLLRRQRYADDLTSGKRTG